MFNPRNQGCTVSRKNTIKSLEVIEGQLKITANEEKQKGSVKSILHTLKVGVIGAQIEFIESKNPDVDTQKKIRDGSDQRADPYSWKVEKNVITVSGNIDKVKLQLNINGYYPPGQQKMTPLEISHSSLTT